MPLLSVEVGFVDSLPQFEVGRAKCSAGECDGKQEQCPKENG